MLTLEQLAEIEKRAQAATEGPWKTGHCEDVAVCHSGDIMAQVCLIGNESELGVFEDAEFIAHSREDVPALLATVRELRDVLAKFDEIKPCAVCGRRIAWRYVGDGTYAINCDDLLVHTCHPPKK